MFDDIRKARERDRADLDARVQESMKRSAGLRATMQALYEPYEVVIREYCEAAAKPATSPSIGEQSASQYVGNHNFPRYATYLEVIVNRTNEIAATRCVLHEHGMMFDPRKQKRWEWVGVHPDRLAAVLRSVHSELSS